MTWHGSIRTALLVGAASALACSGALGQNPASPSPAANSTTPAASPPDAPMPSIPALRTRTPEELRQQKSSVAMINGRPYVRPTARVQFDDYLRDSYGWPAMARSGARALYAQSRGKPTGWGQNWSGFGQRFGSSAAVTAINGNVRYGMETVLREDMRYIPCHGCGVKRKIGNAFLTEVTARHDSDGHRFFTVTPIVADFSGPIIANSFWYPPGHGPLDGLVATRTVVATRVGAHLVREFILERLHKDPPIDGPATPKHHS